MKVRTPLNAAASPSLSEPLKLGGYSVSYRNSHASVHIDQETYKRLKVYLTTRVENPCHTPGAAHKGRGDRCVKV